MKCALGERKVRRIERLIGQPVNRAYVRGGWKHYEAQVFLENGDVRWVNYQTGEWCPDIGTAVPWWGREPAFLGAGI